MRNLILALIASCLLAGCWVTEEERRERERRDASFDQEMASHKKNLDLKWERYRREENAYWEARKSPKYVNCWKAAVRQFDGHEEKAKEYARWICERHLPPRPERP